MDGVEEQADEEKKLVEFPIPSDSSFSVHWPTKHLFTPTC